MLIPQIAGKPVSATDPTLHRIVKDLIDDSAIIAINNRNSIINNIPKGLQVKANQGTVAAILNKIVNTVLIHTRHAGIMITARSYGFAILVQVRTQGKINPHLGLEMEPASLKAKRAGGVIEWMHHQENQATVAYCFLNVAGEA